MPARSDCALRPATLEDAERLRAWRNQDRIRANMYSDHVIGAEEHIAWLTRTLASETDQLMIFSVSDRPVGMTAFTAIDHHNSRCDWGFYIGEDDAPSGSGSAMGWLAMTQGFDVVGIAKVCCEVLDFNAGSLAFLDRLGFRQEGRLVRHRRKGARSHDVILKALFAEDWRARRDAMAATVFR